LLKGLFRLCKRDYSFDVGASRDRTISPSSMFSGLSLARSTVATAILM
jgi:hypothetical protein